MTKRFRYATRHTAAASALLLANCVLVQPSSAAPSNWGSATLLTSRNCNGLANNIDCFGPANPDFVVKQFLYAGGSRATTNAELLPINGGRSVSNITYGVLDMPVIKAGTWAGSDNRLNSNSVGFQSFTYTGLAATPFGLTANYDFTSSGSALGLSPPAEAGVNNFGGEGGGFLFLTLLELASVPNLNTAEDVFNFGFIKSCGDPGVLGAVSMEISNPNAGFAAGSLTLQDACSGGQLLLAPGAEFVTAMTLITPSNRNGYFDATQTVRLGLGDNLTADVKHSLTQSLVSGRSAVPEPATWALMMAGFSLAGSALRRRVGQEAGHVFADCR